MTQRCQTDQTNNRTSSNFVLKIHESLHWNVEVDSNIRKGMLQQVRRIGQGGLSQVSTEQSLFFHNLLLELFP